MRILLLGAEGQLGWELRRSLAPLGEVVALDRHGSGLLTGNLLQTKALATTVRSLAPQVIANAAAYTAVDRAEQEPTVAHAVNAQAPGMLAQEAARLGAWLLHYSSDYVFDGRGSAPWQEDDEPAPLNAYGRSKLAGEQAVRTSGCHHLILRCSWLYAARGNSFARTVLRQARERDRLDVVADQTGAPTGAELVADLSAHMVRAAMAAPELAGTYHVAASGATTRYGWACHLVEHAHRLGMPLRLRPEGIIAVDSRPGAGAARPANSRLDTSLLRERFDLELPDWRAGVERALVEWMTSAP